MRYKLLLMVLAVVVLALPALAQDGPPPPPDLGEGEIVVEGLNGPLGLYIAEDGALWVVDSGMGGEETIEFVTTSFEPTEATFGMTSRVLRQNEDGTMEEIAVLPSVATAEDFLGGAHMTVLDGTVYVTVGVWQANLGDEVTIDNYAGVVAINEGEVELVADLWAYELANNPDETGNIEAHPYGITAGPDGLLYVADAAMNALLSVDPESGEVATVAVFDALPGVFPSPFRNGELLTDPVPTGVIANEDGSFYVSLLSGAPFIPGSAKVMQVAADGTVSDFAPGLTMLTDVTMGPDGNLYAVSFGMFTQEGPVFNSGMIVRILPDGTSEALVEGLPFATAIAVDAEGNGYVTINGIAIPNAGAVVRYAGLTEMEGMAIPMPEMEG